MPSLNAALTAPRLAWTAARGWIARLNADAALRERMFARAVFAAIFAFGVVAFDQIVTGGADWQIGAGQAYARTPPVAPAVVSRAPSAPAFAADDADAPIAEPIFEIDYSFTTETLLGGPDDLAAPDGSHEKHRDAPYEDAALTAPIKLAAF